MQFFQDNAQFFNGAFVMLPRVPDLGTNPPTPWAPTQPAGSVPSYSQAFPDWAQSPYDSICSVWNTTSGPPPGTRVGDIYCGRNQPIPPAPQGLLYARSPIAARGCQLTAMADLLGYHGVHVTPDQLDQWLVDHNGYLPSGDVKPGGISAYAAANSVTLSWLEDSDGDHLHNSLQMCLYGPQVIQARVKTTPAPTATAPTPVPHPAHWALATGYTDNNFTDVWMADPGHNIGGLPYQSGPFTPFTFYRPATELPVARTKIFQGGAQAVRDMRGFYVIFHSPVQFVVTDPSGQQTGYDVSTGTYLNGIPSAGYSDEGVPDLDDQPNPDPPKVFEMPRPPSGDYQIAATGTANGTYSLDVWFDDQNGTTSKMPTMTDVAIGKGETHSFLLSYAPGASPNVAGGFSGGGQRPRDVNRFLSYVTPSSNHITLPSGATSFALILSYGPTTQAATFAATLNGTDATALFQPAPGTMQTVRVPLVSGTNVLKLSIDGSTGTRIATDTDRLVFDVP
jgi:hypothetical protein